MTIGRSGQLAIVLGVAFFLRLLAAIFLPDQHFPDAASYREVAQTIATLHRFDDPYIMPLYPLILAVTGTGWGQLIFDIAMSVTTVALIYALALTLFGKHLVALIAAIAAAVYPYFIFYAVVGLTETLFITLLLAAFAAWYRGSFVVAALCAVLAIMTRPSLELLPPLLALYFALVIHRLTPGAAFRQLAIYGLVYGTLLAPWWLHNVQTYGTFVRLNLGSGMALYSGNNPNNRSGGVSDVTLDTSQFDSITDPIARDRAMRDAALAYITEDPVRALKLAGLKFMRFWRLWPFADPYVTPLYVILSLLSYVPILLFAIAGTLTLSRFELIRAAPILAFIGYLTAVHMIIVGSIRYRLPIEPFLIVLAAPAIVRFALAIRGRVVPSSPGAKAH